MLHDIGRINNSENFFSLNDKRLARIYPTNIYIYIFFFFSDEHITIIIITMDGIDKIKTENYN